MTHPVEKKVCFRVGQCRLDTVQDLDEEKGGEERDDCEEGVGAFASETARVGMRMIIQSGRDVNDALSSFFGDAGVVVKHPRDGSDADLGFACYVVDGYCHRTTLGRASTSCLNLGYLLRMSSKQ